LCESFVTITRTDWIKDLKVLFDSKLHLHHHAGYIFPKTNILLGLIRTGRFSFPSVQSLLTLYCTLVGPKLEHASVAWNSVTSTDASKRERIQRKFWSLCHRPFFSHFQYNYVSVLNYLKCHTSIIRKRLLDTFFFFYLISKLLQNFALAFWKLSAFVCRIEISEILFRSMLTLNIATVLPLDALRRLMQSVGILVRVYSMESLFWLTVC
jgi:hypothetical protein